MINDTQNTQISQKQFTVALNTALKTEIERREIVIQDGNQYFTVKNCMYHTKREFLRLTQKILLMIYKTYTVRKNTQKT